jgi:hypothetical protein
VLFPFNCFFVCTIGLDLFSLFYMALHAIAAFFAPLSSDDEGEGRQAARRACLASDTARAGACRADCSETSEGQQRPPSFVPLRASAPLAFVCAHPLCRVAAEVSQEGVQVGFTHYERPAPQPLPSATYVWDISPTPPLQLSVHVTRLPLTTSGFSEGLWWLRYLRQARPPKDTFQTTSRAMVSFPPFCPVRDIRLVLEKEDRSSGKPNGQHTWDHSPVAERKAVAAVYGSKEDPLCEKDLVLFDGVDGRDCDICGVPFTSLELQRLCFQPAAMRLLPCLFGPHLRTILFNQCSAIFDAMLRDEQRCRYTATLPNATSSAGACGVTLIPPLSGVLPYGASGLSYLGVNACGGEAFWVCVVKFILCPQFDDASPLSLTPLAVLDLADNKSLTPKRLHSVLVAVKRRNTTTVVSRCAANSAVQEQDKLVSLRELNMCFTSAINGIQWRKDFAGLGCGLRRLAMARCDIDGGAVVDILCAGEEDVRHPTVSEVDEPFSTVVRRLLLLDMRWNLKVTSETIRELRDDHAIHCKHLRVAGSGIEWEASHRFASTVTP